MTDESLAADRVELALDAADGRALYNAFLNDDPVALTIADTRVENCIITDYNINGHGTVELTLAGDVELAVQPTND